jgi:hypothetical protein
MLMAFLMLAKWWRFITPKNSITSLIFILNLKKLDKVYNNLKIKLKYFQINLVLEFFMCLMLQLLELLSKLLFIKNSFFSLKFMISSFGNFFIVYIYSSICIIFSQ